MSSIFIDTSIVIARKLHGPKTKQLIENRLAQYENIFIGLVVLQEYKRRVLKEVNYLLSTINRLESYTEACRWVSTHLPPQLNRKRNINLDIICKIGELPDYPQSEKDKTDRARIYLKAFLKYGMGELEESIDTIIQTSGCACAKQEIIFTAREVPNFGVEDCSKLGAECNVDNLLKEHIALLVDIAESIECGKCGIPTAELLKIAEFIRKYLQGTEVHSLEPCKNVGDLLIALESIGTQSFYTMNKNESELLCSCTEQELIVRPNNYGHPDQIIAPHC